MAGLEGMKSPFAWLRESWKRQTVSLLVAAFLPMNEGAAQESTAKEGHSSVAIDHQRRGHDGKAGSSVRKAQVVKNDVLFACTGKCSNSARVSLMGKVILSVPVEALNVTSPIVPLVVEFGVVTVQPAVEESTSAWSGTGLKSPIPKTTLPVRRSPESTAALDRDPSNQTPPTIHLMLKTGIPGGPQLPSMAVFASVEPTNKRNTRKTTVSEEDGKTTHAFCMKGHFSIGLPSGENHLVQIDEGLVNIVIGSPSPTQ